VPVVVTIDRMRAMGRGLLLAGATALVALAVGPLATAAAQPPATRPHVRITSPLSGSATNSQTPVFSGTTDNIFGEERFEEPSLPEEDVELAIYAGPAANGTPVQELKTPLFLHGTWSLQTKALAPGVYTAQAQQRDQAGLGPPSEAVTFTVDTTPPKVNLTFPADGSSTSSGSQQVAGFAGTEAGDLPSITVQLFAGATVGAQAPLETLIVQASNGNWSATFGGLSPGTYTAEAEQRDEAGNVGKSGPVSFTVNSPPLAGAPAPPVASFQWFPSTPHTGEPVSLVSTSTDAASPITAFAWSLSASGALSEGKPVLTTTFGTTGAHVVRLHVVAADGLSSVVAKTILVTSPTPTLMQPFPIVSIAGSESSSGATISLLAVEAAVGVKVTVTCHGHGCPKSEAVTTHVGKKTGKAGTVVTAFRRFERPLRAGVILEIRVYKNGLIGKYTRLVIRRGRPPKRNDTCLGPTGITPMTCPA
jgi:hypothetical protein